MENFNISISVNDCLSCKCSTYNNSTTKIFTSLSDYISLQCGYYLKLISVENNYAVISIDNGVVFFVRKIYTNIPIKICIPNCQACHIITIMINSITE